MAPQEQNAYDFSELRELSFEAEEYLNEPISRNEMLQRRGEVTVMLDDVARDHYYGQDVTIVGLYKRAFGRLVKGNLEVTRFMDDKPITGTSMGFQVVDYNLHFNDLPDSRRQKDIMAQIRERSVGRYGVCHMVDVGNAHTYSYDALYRSEGVLSALGPIATAQVFPEGLSDIDNIFHEVRQQEIQRIIDSAGPQVRLLTEAIEMDLAHKDTIQGLILCARKFRGLVSEASNNSLVQRAVYERISSVVLDRIGDKEYLLSGDLPPSLIFDNSVLKSVAFEKNASYRFLAKALGTYPRMTKPEEDKPPKQTDEVALYIVGHIVDANGPDARSVLIPLEDMHQCDIVDMDTLEINEPV